MTDEEIIKRMAEVEPDAVTSIRWVHHANGRRTAAPYNPLSLSEAGRLIEKFKVSIGADDSDLYEAKIYKHGIISRTQYNPSLPHAICYAILEANK